MANLFHNINMTVKVRKKIETTPLFIYSENVSLYEFQKKKLYFLNLRHYFFQYCHHFSTISDSSMYFRTIGNFIYKLTTEIASTDVT